MSYKKFVSDLKQDMFHRGIFLRGGEDFLIRWAVEQFIQKYSGEFREQNVIDIPGEQADLDDMIGRAMTPSMFPGSRIIVIRNLPMLYRKTADAEVKGPGERLLEFVKHPAEDAFLVLVLDAAHQDNLTAYGKKLEKAASSYTMDRLTLPELRTFIQKRIRTAGKTARPKDIDYMIDVSGYLNRDSSYTLSELENDLRKITLASDNPVIEPALIDELMIGEEDRFVFNLIDLMMAGKKKETMAMLIRILEQDEGNAMQLIALLTTQFEMMLDAAEMEERGYPMREMAKKLGVNEYRFRKAFAAAGRFRRNELKEILIRLYDLDLKIKTGDLDKNLALELFALSL